MQDTLKPILILSDTADHPEPLMKAFADRGFSPFTHPVHGFDDTELETQLPLQPPLAIIFKCDDAHGEDDSNQTIASIKSHYPDANIPVLAIRTATPPLFKHPFDSILIEPCHPAQIVVRTTGLIRLAVMENEISLRLQTLNQDFDIDHVRPAPIESDPFNILFVGQASPEFMVIINALQKKHVQVIAAFTSLFT